MYVTITHESGGSGLFRLELDLDILSDSDSYQQTIEEWQEEVRAAAGYEEGAAVPYQVEEYDGIPDDMMNQQGPTGEAWGYIEVMTISRLDADVFWAAAALSIPPEDVEEAYQGRYRSDEAFAQDLADQLGLVPDDVQWPLSHIAWADAARELMMSDYCEENGHYYRVM